MISREFDWDLVEKYGKQPGYSHYELIKKPIELTEDQALSLSALENPCDFGPEVEPDDFDFMLPRPVPPRDSQYLYVLIDRVKSPGADPAMAIYRRPKTLTIPEMNGTSHHADHNCVVYSDAQIMREAQLLSYHEERETIPFQVGGGSCAVKAETTGELELVKFGKMNATELLAMVEDAKLLQSLRANESFSKLDELGQEIMYLLEYYNRCLVPNAAKLRLQCKQKIENSMPEDEFRDFNELQE